MRTEIVCDAALVLYRRDQPEEQFLMTWREFAKTDPDKGWRLEEIAHALAVPGRSTVTKIVWFMWFRESVPKLNLREGAYILTLCYWTKTSRKPRNQRHEFFVTNETAKALEENRAARSNGSRILWLDKQINYNQVLTIRESKALLGR